MKHRHPSTVSSQRYDLGLQMVSFMAVMKLFLILIFFAQASSGLSVSMTEDDILKGVPVTESILTSTEFNSILTLTDGNVSSDFITKILKNQLLKTSKAVFEFRQDESTFSKDLQFINQIRKSVGILLVIISSDDKNFVTSSIERLAKGNVLNWPSKLLLVTYLQTEELLVIRKLLSELNGIIIVLEKKSDRSNIYSYLPYSERRIKIASWTVPHGLIKSSHLPLFPEKFDRLTDAGHLIVAGDDFPPHMKVIEFPEGIDGPPHYFVGPLGNFVEILGNSINFTYTLVRPPDRAWGYLQPNGSWIGMVGMVFRKEVDFALGPFVFLFTRAQAVDYALPLIGDNLRIAAKRGATEVDPWGFVMPFSPPVWGITFTSMAFVILLSMIFTSIDIKSKLPKASLMDFIRILFQQDMTNSSPIRFWERILLGSWIITILILIKSYSGNLMSLLAVRYVPQPYQSLRAVLDDSSITMLWEGGSAYVQVFMNAESGIYREVAESLQEGRISYVKSSEYDQAMAKIAESNRHVLIIEDLGLQMLLAEDFTKTGRCFFYLSREVFLPSMFGLIVQKYSPLGPAIARRMMSVTESGLYTQWMKEAVPNSTACLHAPTKIALRTSLSIHNLWGMFVLLGSGYVLSFMTLSIEYAVANISLSS